MSVSPISSLEPLESRIAPAGLVTVSFSQGLLTIHGSDDNDHDVTIIKTGTNTFRVEGHETDINLANHSSKNFRGVLNRVLIEGGAGADTFAVKNLSPLKSLRFDGNAGVDAFSATNLTTQLASRVDITLGSETGSVHFDGTRTGIRGYLNIDLGGGGTANFDAATTRITGNVSLLGGAGSDSVEVSSASTHLLSKLTFNGGAGNDSFVADGLSFNVGGNVILNGDEGTNLIILGADTNKFGTSLTPVVVDVNLGTGSGTVAFLGVLTNLYGSLDLELGAAGGVAQVKSAVTIVRNHLLVTGGVGNDSLELAGRVVIGSTLTFNGDSGDDALKATGSGLAVKGATTMDGSIGSANFDLDVASLALAGVSVHGGNSNDSVSIVGDGLIAGAVDIQLGLDGTGPSKTVLKSRAGLVDGLKFGSDVTIAMYGSTVDVLSIANIQVHGKFMAQTGENVTTVDVSYLNAKGDVTIATGSGADVVNIDHLQARDFHLNGEVGADVINLDNFSVRNLAIDTGDGADELRIERRDFAGNSQVLAMASILTGIGADQIRIGNSSNQNDLKVSFLGATNIDAGNDANMINDVEGSNFFSSAPSIGATGGTLTQTAAI